MRIKKLHFGLMFITATHFVSLHSFAAESEHQGFFSSDIESLEPVPQGKGWRSYLPQGMKVAAGAALALPALWYLSGQIQPTKFSPAFSGVAELFSDLTSWLGFTGLGAHLLMSPRRVSQEEFLQMKAIDQLHKDIDKSPQLSVRIKSILHNQVEKDNLPLVKKSLKELNRMFSPSGNGGRVRKDPEVQAFVRSVVQADAPLQDFTYNVSLKGKKPPKDQPTRMDLLLRHNKSFEDEKV
jgi:hypothetical protein